MHDTQGGASFQRDDTCNRVPCEDCGFLYGVNLVTQVTQASFAISASMT
jgi:hypothetical protein